mmetsp:Transcript_18967/g.71787  ORF Transcript_18967/g.71787 Transcript_18967/m.71787 type:complete len:157 (-) Transcript_18967:333-803(-)
MRDLEQNTSVSVDGSSDPTSFSPGSRDPSSKSSSSSAQTHESLNSASSDAASSRSSNGSTRGGIRHLADKAKLAQPLSQSQGPPVRTGGPDGDAVATGSGGESGGDESTSNTSSRGDGYAGGTDEKDRDPDDTNSSGDASSFGSASPQHDDKSLSS